MKRSKAASEIIEIPSPAILRERVRRLQCEIRRLEILIRACHEMERNEDEHHEQIAKDLLIDGGIQKRNIPSEKW